VVDDALVPHIEGATCHCCGETTGQSCCAWCAAAVRRDGDVERSGSLLPATRGEAAPSGRLTVPSEGRRSGAAAVVQMSPVPIRLPDGD